MSNKQALPVLVAGGGIGGLAAALALVRQGFSVKVFEQSPEIGEIGAGIQLGPNAFHAFDALGVGPQARSKAVYTDYMVMHDAIDEQQVGYIPTGEAFRQRGFSVAETGGGGTDGHSRSRTVARRYDGHGAGVRHAGGAA